MHRKNFRVFDLLCVVLLLCCFVQTLMYIMHKNDVALRGAEIGEEYLFGVNCMAERVFLNGGVYSAEDLAWASGNRAEFCVYMVETPHSDLIMRLKLAGVFQPPQRLRIAHSDTILFDKDIEVKDASVEIVIPPVFIESSWLRLQFEFPDAISPAALGINEDLRMLSFDFKSFILESVPEN